MDVVNIFLTDRSAEAMDDFVHDGRRYAFAHLPSTGPRRLVEGPVWAFVDWVMEDLAGLEMCRRLRADPAMAEAHITMVLEADDVEDRRRALRAGADDYVVGPLDRTRVLDRVMATDGRAGQKHAPGRLDFGPLTIDMRALRARWNDVPLDLPPNEFRLLRFMAENANTVLTREELIGGIGKPGAPVDARTVDVWIGRLRRALAKAGAGDALRTVRFSGYVLDLP
jgi:two-component system phosphate regulon response regulator PhoB